MAPSFHVEKKEDLHWHPTRKLHCSFSGSDAFGLKMNEQISCRLGEWSQLGIAPQFLHDGGFPLSFIMGRGGCVEFSQVVFGLNTLLFHWRGAGMYAGMPECLLTLVTAPLSVVDKGVLLGFTRFTGETQGGCDALTQDIATFQSHTPPPPLLHTEWTGGPWCSGRARDRGAWFGHSNQFLLCFVSLFI